MKSSKASWLKRFGGGGADNKQSLKGFEPVIDSKEELSHPTENVIKTKRLFKDFCGRIVGKIVEKEGDNSFSDISLSNGESRNSLSESELLFRERVKVKGKSLLKTLSRTRKAHKSPAIATSPGRGRFVAFTLAEVLVTLSILGVIAAVTVPSVYRNYQKRVTITKLQKAYATLEQAAVNMGINSGCITRTVNCTGIFDMPDAYVSGVGNPRALTQKFLDLTGMKGEIVARPGSTAYIQFLYCAKQHCENGSNDGLLRFYDIKTDSGINYAIRTKPANFIGHKDQYPIIVYVITEQSANKQLIFGKNVFTFLIYDNFKVEPAISNSAGSYLYPLSDLEPNNLSINCNYNKSRASGIGCAAKIVSDGWVMDY